MTPTWADSADKHGIPRADTAYAILHSTYRDELAEPGVAGGVVTLYIGPRHGQTDVMLLGPKFRRHRQENPK